MSDLGEMGFIGFQGLGFIGFRARVSNSTRVSNNLVFLQRYTGLLYDVGAFSPYLVAP